MSNISQIQPTIPPPVQTTSSEPAEKDVDFLVLRQVNKRARIRLSQEPIDLSPIPGKASLFAVANSRGWFAAVSRDSNHGTSLVLSPLADLYSALATASDTDERTYVPQRKVPLGSTTPKMIVFACNDSRLVVGLAEGSVLVYATEHLFSPGQDSVDPIYLLPAVPSAFVVSISSNPGDLPELVAILRDSQAGSNALAVELLDVQKLASVGGWVAGNLPSTTPTSISWSPKGKQLALGMRSGTIVTYAPTSTSTPKSSIPSPPSASDASVISTTWLSASSFYAIYAQPPFNPDVEQIHSHVSLDAKTDSAQDLKFSSPFFPSPGLRPPGAFIICLRGWDPAKTLLFVGDSTSSDIGALGCVEDNWSNLSLEETSTPSLPLDKDMNDTVLIGLELDLTSTEPFHHTSASGEGVKLPPSPVMYAYVSDGTIAGWHVLNVKGTSYPGMVAQPSGVMVTAQTLSAVPSAITREPSSDMNSSPTESTPSATTAPATTSPFGSGSGQASAFGKQPSFGQTSFGQQAASPFGQPPTSNSFGQQTTSAFGQPTTSAFGQPTTSAFGQQATSAFGQPSSTSAFGKPSFGQPSTTSAFGQPTTSAFGQPSTTTAFGKPSFGQSSFGQSSFGQPASAFGSTTPAPSPFGQTGKSAFDATSKTGGAFSAFSNIGPSKFGQTGFGGAPTTAPPAAAAAAAPTPAEDSMAADEAPSFGGLSLGSTGNGSATQGADSKPSIFGTATTQPSFANASSGASLIKPGTGFGAFAGVDPKKSPFSAFGGGSSASALSNVPASTSAFGSAAPTSTSAFAAPASTSAFSSAAAPSSAFGKSGFGQSGFTQPSFGASAFGKPSFGTTAVPPASAPASGGFAAFAAGAPSAFGATASNASGQTKPVWATATTDSVKSDTPKPIFAMDSPRAAPESRSPSPVAQGGKEAAPAFKSSAAPTSTPQSAFATTSTGGFGGFASGTGGRFGAFSGGQKSFGELLKKTGDEAKEPTEPPALAEPATPSKDLMKAEEPSTPTTLAAKKAEEPSTPDAKAEAAQKLEDPLTPNTPVAKEEAAREELTSARTTTPPLPVSEEKGKEKEEPLEFITSSAASSFVDVTAEDATEGAEESTIEDSDEESISDGTSDERDGVSDEESGELESEEGEEEEFQEGDSGPLEPTAVPLPPSIPSSVARSRSTTPNAELPTITLPTSPSPPPRVISPVKEPSTTPPGSPVAESQRAISPVPQSLPKPPATSPFALTPRTTGTRPVKSSPLASAPLTGDTEAPTFVPPVSKSAPPAMVPHPASPRPQFGSWVPPVKQDVETDSSSRPKTPPGLFGKSASAPAIAAPPPLPPAFALPPKPLLPSTPSPPPNIFGAPAQTPTPSVTPSVFSPPPAGFFSFAKPSEPPGVAAPSFPSAFGMPVKTPAVPPVFIPPPPSAFGSTKPPPAVLTTASPSVVAPPAPPMEQSMQSECSYMLSCLTWELDSLKAMAARATQKAAELKSKKVPEQSRVKADLSDPSKWVFGDIKEYGRIMTEIQSDVKEIKEKQMLLKKSLKDLESSMLKAGTRKEEIIRFSRAQTDTEFAKMLKVRTLGPEYLETQSQLRRDIRAMRDRVQKLEDHLQASKKRLAELKTGKPSLKAPSLDTVNKTFRNIDIAIMQQGGDVAKLKQRIGKLDLSSNVLGPRDKRLSESRVKKPSSVIPDVAVTTAAALNAERSAQKLKRALLAAREEPLLNKAVSHPAPPTSFITPGRPAVKPTPETPTPTALLSLPSNAFNALPAFTPGWSPEMSTGYEDSPTYSVSSRRPQRTSRHGSSVKSAAMLKLSESLESSPTPAPKTAAVSFDWGPLPTAIPKTMLSADVRPKSFGL